MIYKNNTTWDIIIFIKNLSRVHKSVAVKMYHVFRKINRPNFRFPRNICWMFFKLRKVWKCRNINLARFTVNRRRKLWSIFLKRFPDFNVHFALFKRLRKSAFSILFSKGVFLPFLYGIYQCRIFFSFWIETNIKAAKKRPYHLLLLFVLGIDY